METRESKCGLKCSLIVEIVNGHNEEDIEVKVSEAVVVLSNTGAAIRASVVDYAQALESTCLT